MSRRSESVEFAPAVVVHWLGHAEAALEAAAELGRPVTLLSPPGAAFTLGPLYFREMLALARERVPAARALDLFDCADAPGRVLEALEAGLEAVVFVGPEAVAAKLARIAEAQGARLVAGRPPALDLLDLERPRQRALAWLAGAAAPQGPSAPA